MPNFPHPNRTITAKIMHPLILCAGLISCNLGLAGQPTVIAVNISEKSASGTHAIMVTVKHADTGWEHYADAIEISLPGGTVLHTRVLMHPHVNEQPFTRGARGIDIPEGASEIRVRAKDNLHGFGDSLLIAVPDE